MNKKLLSLAVAAAVAAPTAAMAEAILYGKLHQSIDYVDITNAVPGNPDYVLGTGLEGFEDSTFTRTVTGYVPLSATYPLQDGSGGDGFFGVPATATYIDRFGNRIGYPNVAYNTSSTDVTVDYFDQNGDPQQVVLQPGESFNFPVDVDVDLTTDGLGIVESRRLYRTDGNGNILLVPGSTNGEADFNGWGISGNSWRKYTTVNPNTGIGGNVNDRANRIGVKGSEDLGNGLKAIYQVEFGINLSSNDNDIDSGNNGIGFRNSFVGIASDYGSLLVGRHDTPLKISTGKLDLFSDTMADYNGTVGFHDVRADNVVAYISPTYAGFSFMGAVIAGGGTNVLGGNDGLNVNDDSLASAYSLALIYNNGPFYASAAYESLGNEHFMNSAVSRAGKGACIDDFTGAPTESCLYVDDDFSKWRIGLGILDWNGFTLTGIYEDQDNLPAGQVYDTVGYIDPNGNVSIVQESGIKSQRLWQIQAGYSFGNNMIKAMYGAVDRDAGRVADAFRTNPRSISALKNDLEGDRETWSVGFDHSFSKRTKVYALYTDVTDEYSDDPRFRGTEWSGFSLGLIHAF